MDLARVLSERGSCCFLRQADRNAELVDEDAILKERED